MKPWLGLLVLLAVPFVSTPATAVLHDRFCTALGEFEDAGDARAAASPLGAQALGPGCLGEMLIGADNDDWYQRTVPITQLVTNVKVEVCPSITKVAPWNPNIEVLASSGLLGISPFVNNLVGQNLGASNNANGCDTVQAQFPLTGFTVYVHVNRATGDGLYSMKVTLS